MSLPCESFVCNNVHAQPCVFHKSVSLREAFHFFEEAEPCFTVMYGYQVGIEALHAAYEDDPGRFTNGAELVSPERQRHVGESVVYMLFIHRKPHTDEECEMEDTE